jgi:hypothetical protein
MGIEQMLDWSKGFLERHRLNVHSVLMVDRLGAHRNNEVIETLEAGSVRPFLISSQASKLVSPCDNSFFASMKTRLPRTNTETIAD